MNCNRIAQWWRLQDTSRGCLVQTPLTQNKQVIPIYILLSAGQESKVRRAHWLSPQDTSDPDPSAQFLQSPPLTWWFVGHRIIES